MAGSTVAAFWAVSFLLVITPGADWAYAIAAGLRHRTLASAPARAPVPALPGALPQFTDPEARRRARGRTGTGPCHQLRLVYTGVGKAAQRAHRPQPRRYAVSRVSR